eukprot:1158599-Lingulodinium_polyedra.AAC.1
MEVVASPDGTHGFEQKAAPLLLQCGLSGQAAACIAAIFAAPWFSVQGAAGCCAYERGVMPGIPLADL